MGLTLLPPTSQAAKWLGFVTAVWVQAISGNNYTFSNYSDALKSLMNLTQLQLNNLSVAKDIGKAFGLLAGLSSDRVPTSVILLIGSVEGFIGYGVQWLVVSQKIRPLSYWEMCIFLCMGGNSSTWMNTAVLVTCMRNFRKNRGPVSGILKGYVGLSTAIFTDLCTALFSDNASSFLLMLAIIPAVICFTAMIFLHEVSPSTTMASKEEKQESYYFQVFNILAIIIAVYLLIYDITGDHSRKLSIAFVAILLFLLATPLSVPLYSCIKARTRFGSSPNPDAEGNDFEPLLIQEVIPDSQQAQEVVPESQQVQEEITESQQMVEVEESGDRKRRPSIGEDHTIPETLKTMDFWILFVSFLCGVGTGLTVMNNMGQIGLAFGYTGVSIFVSFMSIFGFFGRLGSGSISEYFLEKFATPRPVWNAASQIVMAVGYVVMALALPGSLYIGSIVVGICYGVRLAITVPTASELFGLKYYGLIYNILILNLPLGSFLFSGLLAGLLYDAQATETEGGGNTCTGAHCYRLVFIIMACSCVVGFVLDMLLSFRTRNLYAKIQASKKAKEFGNDSKPIKL